METEKKMEPKVAIDRLTGLPYAYRDDSDAGKTADLAAEEGILDNLVCFTPSELEVAKRLGVLPETLRGGGA